MINIFKRWFSNSKEQDIDDSQNPWAGLASYEDPETAKRKLKFCGRDDDSYDLARLIMGNVFVTLYGRSGIGKTSLLNAGVFPELREENYTPVSIRLGVRDEEHPQSYQTVIVEAIEHVVKRTESIGVIDEQQDQQSIDYLWNYFACHRFYDKYDELTTPVVVLDQFEEVFRGHRDEAETLLRQLDFLNDKDHTLDSCEVNGQPYRYEQNFRFVVSIREDDLYRLEDSIDNCYLPALKRCRYRLRSLSEQGARDAILIPAQGLFLPEEQDRIVDTIVGIIKSKSARGISTNILSLICSRIFVEYQKSGVDHITPALVDTFIKGNPFECFYHESTRNFSNREKAYIEDHFVDSTGHRNSVSSNDFFRHLPHGETLLKGDSRILQRISTSMEDGNYRVELIHDSFCEAILHSKKTRFYGKLRTAGLLLVILLSLYGVSRSFYSFLNEGPKSTGNATVSEANVLNFSDTLVVLDSTMVRKSFINQSSIKHVIVKGVDVPSACFANCVNLETLEIEPVDSSAWININPYAFSNCQNLQHIVIDSDVEVWISNDAFSYCNNLKRLDLQNATYLGDNAFGNCKSLQTVRLGNSIRRINENLFYGCISLTEVSLGDSIEEICRSAFLGCNQVSFQMGNNPYYMWYADNVLLSKKRMKEDVKQAILYYHYSNSESDWHSDTLALPDEYKDYRDIKIDEHYSIVNLSFCRTYEKELRPGNEISEGYWYENSKSIEKLDLSHCNGMAIGFKTFANCPNLREIVFPDSIDWIGGAAFINDTSLVSIDLSDTRCDTIYGNAFAGCKNLKYVKLPPTIRYIGRYAFDNCAIKEIDMSNIITNVDIDNSFTNCDSLLSFVFPSVLADLNMGLFYGCKNLKKVKLPDRVIEWDEKFEKDSSWTASYEFCRNVVVNMSDSSLFHCQNGLLDYDQRVVSCIDASALYDSADVGMANGFFGDGGLYIYSSDQFKLCAISSRQAKIHLPSGAILAATLPFEDIQKVDFSDSYYYMVTGGYVFPRGIMWDDRPYSVGQRYSWTSACLAYPLENDSVVWVPKEVFPVEYFFNVGEEYYSNLREVHIPFSSPGFDLAIDAKLKKQITLYVPYGCRENYVLSNQYGGYKDIKEDGLFRFMTDRIPVILLPLCLMLAIFFTFARAKYYLRDISTLEVCCQFIACLSIALISFFFLRYHTVTNSNGGAIFAVGLVFLLLLAFSSRDVLKFNNWKKMLLYVLKFLLLGVVCFFLIFLLVGILLSLSEKYIEEYIVLLSVLIYDICWLIYKKEREWHGMVMRIINILLVIVLLYKFDSLKMIGENDITVLVSTLVALMITWRLFTRKISK